MGRSEAVEHSIRPVEESGGSGRRSGKRRKPGASRAPDGTRASRAPDGERGREASSRPERNAAGARASRAGSHDAHDRESRTSRARYLAAKRAMDVLLASIALVLSLPLIAVLAVLVYRTLGRPVFFAHERAGKDGEPFVLYKFRTMTDERDASGRRLPDAQRLTKLGRFMRAASLDELPSLYNVLKGDMSLVGPRPLPTVYLDRYSPKQFRRHEAMPGITGWAQVNGRNAIDWDEKFAHDVWYVDHASLALDLEILAATVVKVLRREGVSAENHPTMPDFLGSSRD